MRVAGGGEETHALVLVLERLGMLERQIEEETQRRINRPVMARRDRRACDSARFLICRKSARRAAEEIARKLIEQECERERTVGAVDPVVERARRGSLASGQKRAALRVESVVLRKPRLAAGAGPEGENGGRVGQGTLVRAVDDMAGWAAWPSPVSSFTDEAAQR